MLLWHGAQGEALAQHSRRIPGLLERRKSELPSGT
jgi:hypothetical protein